MGHGGQLSVLLHIRSPRQIAVTLFRRGSPTAVEVATRSISSLSTILPSSICNSPAPLSFSRHQQAPVTSTVTRTSAARRVISTPSFSSPRCFPSLHSLSLLRQSQPSSAVAVVSGSTSAISSCSFRQFASSASPSSPPPRQSPSSSPSSTADSFQYCIDIVRKNDYENYLAILLLPKGCHQYMFAIRAFNVELALVRNQIQRYSGTTGIYRLQFWKDTIDFLYGVKKGPVPRQPVAVALKKFAPSAEKELLYQLVESRQQTLGDRPFANVAALEDYGRKTHGALLRFAVAAVGQQRPSLSAEQASVCAQVCDVLGSALGLGTHLRATGPLLARGIVVLPADLMAIHGLSQEAVFSSRDPPAFKRLSRDLGQLAEKRLLEARAMTSQIPREFRPVFLPAVALENFLTGLKKTDYNLLDAKLQRTFGLLSWQLGWRKLCGKF